MNKMNRPGNYTTDGQVNLPIDQMSPSQQSRRSSDIGRGWDVFETTIGGEDNYDWAMYDKVIKLVKLIVLIITSLIVLISSIISKGTFHLMVSQIGSHQSSVCNLNTPNLSTDRRYYLTLSSENDYDGDLINNEKIVWFWCLFFSLISPELLTLFRSLRSVFSSASTWPTFKILATITIMEIFRSIGIGLLTFYILPSLNVLFGLMITSSICLIPIILQLISFDDQTKRRDLIYLKIIATIISIVSLICWPLIGYFYQNSMTIGQLISLPFILTIISLGWTENYLPTDSYLSKILSPLLTIRESLASSRYLIYLIVSPLKIITWLLTMILANYYVNNITAGQLFNSFHLLTTSHPIVIKEDSDIGLPVLITSNSIHIYLMITQIVSSLICYIAGKFACKICVQTSAFALPISLTTPILLSIGTIICHTKSKFICLVYNYFYFLPGYIFWYCPDKSFIEHWSFLLVLTFWFTTYLTSVWSPLHIWSPPRERTARTEKLFVSPLYCAAFIDISLAFNRRREKQQTISQSDLTIIPTSTGGLGQFDSTELSDHVIHDSDRITRIYACVTMWHETSEEMLQTIKSLMKMDEDQSARANAQKYLKVVDPDYYQFETHIMFDDAFELSDEEDDQMVVNRHVKQFCDVVNEAVSAVHRTHLKLRPPTVIPTPYGGKLIWLLPGKTKLIVHLKDKAKIRHKKRWSQIMYMYYLLGYLLMDTNLHISRKAVRGENTYLLTLDGDISFNPPAVLLLIDLMKKNGNLGAACGRLHPIGSGLMVWYQKFEYAVSHWLQKAAEHVFGCVLCSPGAFSLFRARSLMSPNVMATYASESKEPIDFVQHDQGEDRWLCTLLLQSGHRVEYNAASDAFTHCPESFNEFFIQRRRWGPSTIANIIDLLQDYKNIINVNQSISIWYIGYQSFLMLSTIIGPGTILLMLVGAVNSVFKLDYTQSLAVNLIPVAVFIIVCFVAKNDIQLFLAQILSAAYVFLMLAVLIGTAIQIKDEPFSPSTLFFFILVITFLVAAILHPREITCYFSFPLYMLCIPSMYLILQLYSLINLNVVSWGTREAPTKPTKQSNEASIKEVNKSSGQSGQTNTIVQFLNLMENQKSQEANVSFSFGNIFRCLLCTHDTRASDNIQLVRVEEAIKDLSTKVNSLPFPSRARRASELSRVTEESTTAEMIPEMEEYQSDIEIEPEKVKIVRDDLKNPYWIEDPAFADCPVVFLSDHETTFWKELIAKYLYPIDKNADKEARISAGLKDLRDKVMFGVLMINAIFLLTIFLLQMNKDKLSITLPFRFDLAEPTVKNDGYIDSVEDEENSKLEPVGASFIICFALLLIIQTIGMFKHRLSTLSHILAFVQLDYFNRKKLNINDDEYIEANAIEIAKDLQCLRGIDEEVINNEKGIKNQDKGKKSVNEDEQLTKGINQRKTLERKNTIYNLERKREKKSKTLTLDVVFRRRFLALSSSDADGLSRIGGNLRRRQAIEALERRRDRLLSTSTRWIDSQPTERSSSSSVFTIANRVTPATNRPDYLDHNNFITSNREIINPVVMINDGFNNNQNNYPNQFNNNSYAVITRSRLTNLRTFGHYYNNNNNQGNNNHSGYQSSSESSVNNMNRNNLQFNNIINNNNDNGRNHLEDNLT